MSRSEGKGDDHLRWLVYMARASKRGESNQKHAAMRKQYSKVCGEPGRGEAYYIPGTVGACVQGEGQKAEGGEEEAGYCGISRLGRGYLLSSALIK